eukprot:COSAG02_NODE_70476_length_195_cov_100.937500_1_plen_48_part_01
MPEVYRCRQRTSQRPPAAHFASKQSRVGTTKTVKFVDSPTIEQLRRQL